MATIAKKSIIKKICNNDMDQSFPRSQSVVFFLFLNYYHFFTQYRKRAQEEYTALNVQGGFTEYFPILFLNYLSSFQLNLKKKI